MDRNITQIFRLSAGILPLEYETISEPFLNSLNRAIDSETVEKVPKKILGKNAEKMTSQNAPQSTISQL